MYRYIPLGHTESNIEKNQKQPTHFLWKSRQASMRVLIMPPPTPTFIKSIRNYFSSAIFNFVRSGLQLTSSSTRSIISSSMKYYKNYHTSLWKQWEVCVMSNTWAKLIFKSSLKCQKLICALSGKFAANTANTQNFSLWWWKNSRQSWYFLWILSKNTHASARLNTGVRSEQVQPCYIDSRLERHFYRTCH